MNVPFHQQMLFTERETVTFGGQDFWVIDIQSGKALLLAKDIVEKKAYHARNETVTWENCSLRAYLNSEYYNRFSDEEKQRIQVTNILNSNNPAYGTEGGKTTSDKVFLLSVDEANKYFSNDSQRMAGYQGAARWWWLRSPGIGNHAAFVYKDGFVNVHGYRVDYALSGVRPAMYVIIMPSDQV